MSSRLTFSYQSLLIQRKVNFERIKLNKIGGENKDKGEFEQHFPKKRIIQEMGYGLKTNPDIEERVASSQILGILITGLVG